MRLGRGDRWRARPVRRLAASWALPLYAALGTSCLAWLGSRGSWHGERHVRGGHRRLGTLRRVGADDLDDVILVPMDEDTLAIDEFAPEAELGEEQPMDGFPDAGMTQAQRKSLGIGSVTSFDDTVPPPLPLPKAGDLRVALPSAPTASASTGTNASGAGAPVRPKRWLAGRGSAKRKKLEENSRLEVWLRKNGVWVSDKADWGQAASAVSMAIETRESLENEVSGRGLVATRDINQYEELARVPYKLLFTKESSRQRFGDECIPANMSEYTAIALQLVMEKYEGEKSFFAPYLAVLPAVADTGSSFAWPEEELRQLLTGSPLMNMSLFLMDRVTNEFRALKAGLLKEYPDKFLPEAFTEEQYIWAYSILFSRAARLKFPDSPEDFIALVPYIDLINHNPTSETYITGTMDGTEIPFGISEKEKVVVVQADKYYNKYEQIYLSYGPKSNAQLLMLYGFSLERNTQDFLEVGAGHLLDDSPLSEAKKRFLDRRGVERSFFPLYRDRFTSEMMQFLRLVSMQPQDLNLQDDETDENIDFALESLDWTTPFGELSERRALLMLKDICERLMSEYPNTLEEDEMLIQQRSMFELLPKNQRNAIRVRYSEKLILRNTLNTLNRVMNNLGTLTEMEAQKASKERKMRSTFWGRLGVEFDPAIKATNIEELMKELDI